jgi:hypothetical protein
LGYFISFQSPDIDLKHRMFRITLNNPNFSHKITITLNFITGQDKFSFNLGTTSNFRSLTFSLWWIYSGMTNKLKPYTTAGSGIVCARTRI